MTSNERHLQHPSSALRWGREELTTFAVAVVDAEIASNAVAVDSVE